MTTRISPIQDIASIRMEEKEQPLFPFLQDNINHHYQQQQHHQQQQQQSSSLSSSSSSDSFATLFHRLEQLEKWHELAIRPSTEALCHQEDLDLFRSEQDDLAVLTQRCQTVRETMNHHLPPHKQLLDDHLVSKTSQVPNAGLGLFYEPELMRRDTPTCTAATTNDNNNDNNDDNKDDNKDDDNDDQIIPKGTPICIYTGHVHTYASVKRLKDRGYLMAILEGIFVDPGPVHRIKARYINDPLNEDVVNCMYEPHRLCAIVVAKRGIRPGEELFASYGDGYWAQQPEDGTILQPKGPLSGLKHPTPAG